MITVSAAKPQSGRITANVRYVGISPATSSMPPKPIGGEDHEPLAWALAAGREQRPEQRADGEDRAEDAVLAGALAVDLGRHQGGGHLEVQPERAGAEHDGHHEHDVRAATGRSAGRRGAGPGRGRGGPIGTSSLARILVSETITAR